MEWAKQVIEAIVPFLVVHQGYDAKGPKDLPPAKTFGIWLPEDEGLSISDTLTLVFRNNAKISRRDLETKHSAKGNEGVLHVVSVREPSLTTLKELNYNPYIGYRRVQFQKKKNAKQFQNQRWSLRGRPWPRGRPRGHIFKSLALALVLVLALASKPQVLGLGLEASSPRKLPCPRLEDSTFFKRLKFC